MAKVHIQLKNIGLITKGQLDALLCTLCEMGLKVYDGDMLKTAETKAGIRLLSAAKLTEKEWHLRAWENLFDKE